MPYRLKHWDILALGVVVAAVIVGALLYERALSAREQGMLNGLDGEAALYGGSFADRREPRREDVSTAPTGTSVTPESTAPPQSERRSEAPKPLESGVVHRGPGSALGGQRPFPDDDPWNRDISEAPVDPLSDLLIARIGRRTPLHPDFGAGRWKGARIGIPYVVVSGDQPKVPVVYDAYGNESDPGPFPIPPGAPIEGHPNLDGDRHVIVIDRDNWKLYELFRAFPVADGRMWRADSGAVFDLKTNTNRPEGWTSADAAGLPIFPGLVRYDEVVEMKEIRHALRFTVSRTRRAYVPPASHWASRETDPGLPPMGMRVRLKADYDISGFPAEVQVILKALKQYGMILADNGSDWYISGAPDPRWDDAALRTLKRVRGEDFEVIQMEGLVADGP